jgi:hypothetical protein
VFAHRIIGTRLVELCIPSVICSDIGVYIASVTGRAARVYIVRNIGSYRGILKDSNILVWTESNRNISASTSQ